jgi:hypothetical protein
MEAPVAFSVQWLKDGKVIHTLPMTGETLDEVAQAALPQTPEVVKATGENPEQLRVIDHDKREGANYPIKKVAGGAKDKPEEPPAGG